MNERRCPQISGHGEKLTRQHERAIAALLAEPTIERAAASVGVAESTLRRWLKLLPFREQYAEARRGLVDKAVEDLQRASGDAVRVLRDIATDTENPPTARVAAARSILAEVYRGTEVLDLADRIDRLEQSIPGGTGDEKRAASA